MALVYKCNVVITWVLKICCQWVVQFTTRLTRIWFLPTNCPVSNCTEQVVYVWLLVEYDWQWLDGSAFALIDRQSTRKSCRRISRQPDWRRPILRNLEVVKVGCRASRHHFPQLCTSRRRAWMTRREALCRTFSRSGQAGRSRWQPLIMPARWCTPWLMHFRLQPSTGYSCFASVWDLSHTHLRQIRIFVFF